MEGEVPFAPSFERVENLVDLTDRDRDRVDHPRTVVKAGQGNLYSSEIAAFTFKGMHAPTLDIDMPCYLVESTTQGHHHLYIDKAMPWPQYAALLIALRDAEILQPGYVDLSLARGASHVRKPGVEKHEGEWPDS